MPELSLSYSNTVAVSGMQIGCLQVHREHPGKDPTQFLGKEPQLSWEHQALQGHGWHLHMWVIILRERHQVQQLLSQVSQPAHHSQPTFAASLPSGCPRIFGISRRSPAASLSQCPQIFCPSCLLVLKLTPAHPKTQFKSHLLHEAFCDFPQADGTAPPLPPLSVLQSRGIKQVGWSQVP